MFNSKQLAIEKCNNELNISSSSENDFCNKKEDTKIWIKITILISINLLGVSVTIFVFNYIILLITNDIN